jgi:DNA-binding transcriptional LysR family regulator
LPTPAASQQPRGRSNLVPSALTYRVRQIEDALDVLLFDRSSRQARMTEAGAELLREGGRLLLEIDAVANRVKRVATGWETQLTLAADGLMARPVLMELACAFFQLEPPTRLRFRDETLSGTLEALTSGQADLALGVSPSSGATPGLHSQSMGSVGFVFAVAPHHPLATGDGVLDDDDLRSAPRVAVADSVQRGSGVTVSLLGGQDVFTVPTMQAKLDAQLRGLGGGFLPEPMARPYIETGRLVVRRVARAPLVAHPRYVWRASDRPGRALQWWLDQLQSPVTRLALLEQHHH